MPWRDAYKFGHDVLYHIWQRILQWGELMERLEKENLETEGMGQEQNKPEKKNQRTKCLPLFAKHNIIYFVLRLSNNWFHLPRLPAWNCSSQFEPSENAKIFHYGPLKHAHRYIKLCKTCFQNTIQREREGTFKINKFIKKSNKRSV